MNPSPRTQYPRRPMVAGPFALDMKTWHVRDAHGRAVGRFSFSESCMSIRVTDDERDAIISAVVAALDATFPAVTK